MHCLGVWTTALKGGVILILTLFSVSISMLVRSGNLATTGVAVLPRVSAAVRV